MEIATSRSHIAMLSQNDLEICSRTLAELGNDQADLVRTSLAWVIRNRIERMGAASGETPPVARACETILREALAPASDLSRKPRLPNPEWRRIRAATRLVWCGGVPDQTGGAVACHRHDATPAWAKKRTATALLGAFLFFR
jgi:hypothetical protein